VSQRSSLGALFGVSLPVKAGQLVWVRTQKVDYFRARGLMPPGSYSHDENKKPAPMAVTKAGEGLRNQKQTVSKAVKKSTQRVRLAESDS
jgi:hypothetical protein